MADPRILLPRWVWHRPGKRQLFFCILVNLGLSDPFVHNVADLTLMAVTNSSPTPPTRLLPYRGSNAACHCILSAHVCTRNLTKFAFHCNFWRLSAAKRLTCRFSLETFAGAKLFQYCAHVCSGMTMSDLFWGPPAKTEHQNQLGICLPQRMPTTEIVENQTPERCSWDCRSSNHVIPNPQSSPRNASASEVSSLEAFATGQLAELAASRVPFELARALLQPKHATQATHATDSMRLSLTQDHQTHQRTQRRSHGQLGSLQVLFILWREAAVRQDGGWHFHRIGLASNGGNLALSCTQLLSCVKG